MTETVIIKKLRELSINELGEMLDLYGDKVKDFEAFQVCYGKKWQLLSVKPCILAK
ncbi:MAG: hypothetical protein [Bacteriophage sp.]|nr:MAG: hypothetical protein [Bacteriophage sp.]